MLSYLNLINYTSSFSLKRSEENSLALRKLFLVTIKLENKLKLQNILYFKERIIKSENKENKTSDVFQILFLQTINDKDEHKKIGIICTVTNYSDDKSMESAYKYFILFK